MPRGLPVVTTGYAPELPQTGWVAADERGGAAGAVRHLLECGHERIAQIAGPEGRYDTEERLGGFEDAMRAAGHIADRRLVRHGSWTPESGYERCRELLDSAIPFSALFVHSDLMAIGAMQALRERGVAIPGEVAVVGFDDIEIARFLDPPLSTVAQPFHELGRRGVRMLVDRIEGRRERAKSVVLPTDVVVRGSSCARAGTAKED